MKKQTLNDITPFGHASLTSADDLELKGLYMRSLIYADTRAKCVKCQSEKFVFKKQDAFGGAELPVCVKCGGNPNVYRLRRILPIGSGGSAQKIDIRYDRAGDRLKEPFQVVALISRLDMEIKAEKFDPKQYQSEEIRDEYLFESFLKNEYLPIQERKLANGELTPSGYRNKKTAHNHLKTFLDGVDIREISRGKIFKMFEVFPSGRRARDLALQELRVILNKAYELEIISSIPSFPKFQASKKRNVKEFINNQMQTLIVSEVEEYYRPAIQILIKYAIRPCDVKTLRRNDLDFENRVIKIDEHTSCSTPIPGRKSDREAELLLPMDDEFLDIISKVELPYNPDELIFKGKEGGVMSEKALSNAWNRAKDRLLIKGKISEKQYLEISKTGLYVGTKHSTLSALKQKGFSDSQIILLSGHSNVRVLERYAQHTDKTKLESIRSMIDTQKVSAG